MATHPKLPEAVPPPHRPADDHARVQVIRPGKFPWPLVALIAGAVLLLAIIGLLPRATRAPSDALVQTQPTADQVQFTDLKIVPAPVGDTIYLTGVLHNTGSTEIAGVQVEAEFLARNGPVLATIAHPVESMANRTTSQDMTQAPIKPNEARSIRIAFEHTPKGWNHQLPELTVTTVTGTKP